MHVMVINSGSSSIKYQLFDMPGASVIASGRLERIGEPVGRLTHVTRDGGTQSRVEWEGEVASHAIGMGRIADTLAEAGAIADPAALFGIGHRVVHGGEGFKAPTIIDDAVRAAIREQIPLAPLHNPANLTGIEAALTLWPRVPHVAVFDTAFHQSLPPHAYLYALPTELYERYQVRRYGFHGTSYQYVSKQAARHLGRPLASLNLILLHLGNGSSAAAVEGGRCVDTSMGITPLEGLIMGTRCGDLDPAIVFYLERVTGRSGREIESWLNEDSGLKGLCGANDMRQVLARAGAGDQSARLALDLFSYRIRKYIGAYYAVLGRVDAVVFTAGIGENSPEVRARACEGLTALGIEIDPAKNASSSPGPREIQSAASPVRVLVVPTNEELEIAEQTVACIRAKTH